MISRYRLLLVGFLFPSLLLLPAGARPEIIDEVAVVVNDDVILRSELVELIEPFKRAYLSESGSRQIDRAFVAQARMLVEEVIAGKLILQQAGKQGVEIEESRVDQAMKADQAKFGSEEEFRNALAERGETLATWRERKKEGLLVRKVTASKQRELRQQATISEQEVQDYYGKHGKELGPGVTLRRLFVAADKGMSPTERAEKRALIEGALAEIKGGADFEGVAERLSNGDGSRTVVVGRGELPSEVERAVFSMGDGEVGDVLESEQGFYIVKVVRAASQEPPPLSDVRAEIESRLRALRVQEKFNDWLENLRKNAQVKQYFRWNDILSG
jgi:peptidyl-prolyl cis-trans isomerase SurA